MTSSKLPPRIESFFNAFCSGTNKSLPNHNDLDRFCSFIMPCHQGRSKLMNGDVAHLLQERGFDEDGAGYLGDIYEVGRMMCKKEKEEAYVRVVGS